MSLNIDTLVTRMRVDKDLPEVVQDIILNTCYHGLVNDYDSSVRSTNANEIKTRLVEMCRQFVVNSYIGIVKCFKFVLHFLVVLQNIVKPSYSKQVLPWNDSKQMTELLASYQKLFQMEDQEYRIWDGDRTEDILRIIDEDLTEKIDALKDTESVDYAAPEECTNKFETPFFELLVFTVRAVLRDEYFWHTAVIGNALERFYATNIVEDTGVRFGIQSLSKHTFFPYRDFQTRAMHTELRWKKHSDPEFVELTGKYSLLEPNSEDLARLNKLLVFSGVRPDFFYGQMPKRNTFKLTTEELISDAISKFESQMLVTYLFESESHHVEIEENVCTYVLSKLRQILAKPVEKPVDTVPKAAGFTFKRPATHVSTKRPATHVSFGTLSEAPGSPKSVAKKKDGSDNTFLIIALLLVAVGIVVFFV